MININDNTFCIDLTGIKKPLSEKTRKKLIAFNVIMSNEFRSILLLEYINSHLCLYSDHTTIRFLFISKTNNIAIQQYGLLTNVSVIYTLILSPIKINSFQCNTIVYKCKNDLEIVINGKGRHSSIPHLANNPINVGTEIITRLNKISSRELIQNCLI